jgi:hypothetical protein
MPMQYSKPTWWKELEQLWRENRTGLRHTGLGRKPNVPDITAQKFCEQLQALYDKTGAYQFKSALRALQQLELIDDGGRWVRNWTQPINEISDGMLCWWVDQEVDRSFTPQKLRVSFQTQNGWTGERLSYEMSEKSTIRLEGEKLQSITRACAMIAAEVGLPAASFQAAIKILEKRYKAWKRASPLPKNPPI